MGPYNYVGIINSLLIKLQNLMFIRYPKLKNKIEEFFSAGGKAFTKLDLSQAFQQLLLDDESKQLTTTNTHKGLYRYNRLPFGVSAAPAIFQRTIEILLRGVPNVCIYLADILVTGKTDTEHLEHLSEVLTRLESAGLKLKCQKCVFLLTEIGGHRITPDSLKPTTSKSEQSLMLHPPN